MRFPGDSTPSLFPRPTVMSAKIPSFFPTNENLPMHNLTTNKLRTLRRSLITLTCLLLTLNASLAQAPSQAPPQSEEQPVTALQPQWRSLLGDTLSGWETWMGVPHQSVAGLPPIPDDRKGLPLGLNNDVKLVFSVIKIDGEPVLHVTGEIFGGISTLESFGNYHLQLETRWGTKRWEPRATAKRDSGLLIHCQGQHGAFGKNWKKCLECQVQEGDLGDLFPLAGPRADVRQVIVNNIGFYSPTGELMPAKQRVAHLQGDFEKTNGEWNLIDVYTIGQKAVFVVNGHVVNVIENTRTNKDIPLVSGQIQLQSEGAEVEYRRIRIQAITQFPKELNVEP